MDIIIQSIELHSICEKILQKKLIRKNLLI